MLRKTLSLLVLGLPFLSLPSHAALPSPVSIEADMRLARLVLGEPAYIDYSCQWGVIKGWNDESTLRLRFAHFLAAGSAADHEQPLRGQSWAEPSSCLCSIFEIAPI
jgi:hypothetical protein